MKNPGKLSSVILWSVISAAFIGPGTVTTAVVAGSQFQLRLLWSVLFATFACIVLQEVSARISIATGITFGESLVKKFGTLTGKRLQWIIGGSVILGCAAYEAGNILGAVSGVQLILGGNAKIITMAITIGATIILWVGGSRWISRVMIGLVLMMGIAFFTLASSQSFSFHELLVGSVVPSIPSGSELILLGLIGTTIVPYNIFIGSGISKDQTISMMRIGLLISVLIGGIITASIVIAAVGIESFSSFESLSITLSQQLGTWGGLALALGLFAAGFSSAITSPFAASMVASTVFEIQNKNTLRIVWSSVLLIGFFFGMSGIKPIPVILAVQAINGLILPLVTAYLILVINDRNLIPQTARHPMWYNMVLLIIFFSVLVISLNNIDKTISSVFETSAHLMIVLMASSLITAIIARKVMVAKRL